MESFREWMHKVDEQQIDAVYDKAHIAVEIVNWYSDEHNLHLLDNVSTIANLATGVYGLYNSAENQKKLPMDAEKRLIYYGAKKQDLGKIPSVMLQQYGVDPKSVQIGDTIHVNVRRILSESKSDWEAVLKVASTIIHEATHEIEREKTGNSDEIDPKRAEEHFMRNWVPRKEQAILQKYPELRGGYGI